MNVGMRVRCIKDYEGKAVGLLGTIVAVDPYIAVEFDKHICGHTGRGHGKSGHCWEFPKNYTAYLQPISWKDWVNS